MLEPAQDVEGDDVGRGEGSRRVRSTRRRSDVADLPRLPTEPRSVGAPFTTPTGRPAARAARSGASPNAAREGLWTPVPQPLPRGLPTASQIRSPGLTVRNRLPLPAMRSGERCEVTVTSTRSGPTAGYRRQDRARGARQPCNGHYREEFEPAPQCRVSQWSSPGAAAGSGPMPPAKAMRNPKGVGGGKPWPFVQPSFRPWTTKYSAGAPLP
jgi:hypothetical protein